MMPALLSLSSKLATLISRLTSTRASNLDNLNATVSSRSTLTSAQAASAVWGADTRTLTTAPSAIKSIQRGTVQITSQSLTATVSITTVNASKSFITSTIAGPWDQDDVSRLRLAISSNGQSLVATRYAADGGVPSGIVSYEIVEFN